MDSEALQALVGGMVAVTFLLVCAVALVVFAVRGWRRGRTLSADDQAGMQTLLTTATRMETRITTLETVLDTEVPGWRSRSLP